MEDNTNRDPRILEALEACRPGSDDLADLGMSPLADALAASPELARTYERLQRLDTALAAAFQDVPVPEGMENRLLARLGIEPQKAAPEPAAKFAPRKPRRWALAASVLAAAASILAAAAYLLHAPPEDGRSIDWTVAIDRFNSELERGVWGGGRSIASTPVDYPFSQMIVEYGGVGWRKVRGLIGRSGIAYDIRGPRGTRATLYVLDPPPAMLPSSPGRDPLTTGNRAVAAWQENGLLYVLVVEGGDAQFREFMNAASGVVT